MKKVIAWLMLASILLTGCGDQTNKASAKDRIRQEPVIKETVAEAAQTEATEMIWEVALAHGEINGTSYIDEQSGFAMDFNEFWTLEEITKEEDLSKIEENQGYYNIAASTPEGAFRIQLNYARATEAEINNYMAHGSESAANELMATSSVWEMVYETGGFEAKSVNKISADYLGERVHGMKMVFQNEEMDAYVLMVRTYYEAGYCIDVTVRSYVEDYTEELLDMIYLIEDGSNVEYGESAVPDETKETESENIDDRTVSLISFLEAYNEEWGDWVDPDYFGIYAPAILEDIDGDGEDELIIHTCPVVEYDEDSPYGPQVEQFAVYGYGNGEWEEEKAPQTIGSCSYTGFSGRAGVLYRDGEPVLFTLEWKTPYGTGGGPGCIETTTITIFDKNYKAKETFSAIQSWEGDYDSEITEIVTYEVNGRKASLDKIKEVVGKYEGLSINAQDQLFDIDVEGITVQGLIDQLKGNK